MDGAELLGHRAGPLPTFDSNKRRPRRAGGELEVYYCQENNLLHLNMGAGRAVGLSAGSMWDLVPPAGADASLVFASKIPANSLNKWHCRRRPPHQSHIPPANDLYGGFLSVIDIYFQSGGEAGL